MMTRNPLSQIGCALRSPRALARLPLRSWAWLVLYLGLSSAILALIAWQLGAHKDELRALLLGYFFPESWHTTVDFVIDRYFAEQHAAVIVNATIALGLACVSLLLFPVKEQVSASFEVHASLTDEPIEELSLAMQGWEEVKLFLLFVAVQGSIFWIGYGADPVRTNAAIALSYFWLFYSFAIDWVPKTIHDTAKQLLPHPDHQRALGADYGETCMNALDWAKRHQKRAFLAKPYDLSPADNLTTALDCADVPYRGGEDLGEVWDSGGVEAMRRAFPTLM